MRRMRTHHDFTKANLIYTSQDLGDKEANAMLQDHGCRRRIGTISRQAGVIFRNQKLGDERRKLSNKVARVHWTLEEVESKLERSMDHCCVSGSKEPLSIDRLKDDNSYNNESTKVICWCLNRMKLADPVSRSQQDMDTFRRCNEEYAGASDFVIVRDRLQNFLEPIFASAEDGIRSILENAQPLV